MKHKRKQISSEISVRILTVVITIFIVFSAVMLYIIGRISLRTQQKNLTLQSQSCAYQLNSFFTKYLTIVEQTALNSTIQEILESTGDGESIQASALYKELFEELKKIENSDSENILACWVADLDANVLTQSDGFTSDDTFDVTQREWYQTTKLGTSMLTTPYIDASTGLPILSAAAPIYDKTGKNVLGVAGVDFTLSHINNLFSNYIIGENGFIILLTADGTLAYHPNETYQFQNISVLNTSNEVMNALQSDNAFLSYYLNEIKYYGYIDRIGNENYFVLSCLPSNEYFSSLNGAIFVTLLLVCFGLVAIIIAIRKVATSLTKPIIHLNQAAQELASGNLNVQISIDADNEIGELSDSFKATVSRLQVYINYIDEISEVLNLLAKGKLKFSLQYDYNGEFSKVKEALLHISSSMQQIMENIITSSQQVSIGADGLSKASQSIAENTTLQAHFIQELVTNAVSVSNQVNENAKDAKDSALKTEKVTTMMQSSKQQVNQLMSAINKINETSNQVVTIIKTIENIADQTNLLSLNASIEAARAGEAGKGFAVVASEIGSLADESAKAANTTKELISVSIQEIEFGTSLANQVVISLQEVLNAIEAVNQMIGKSAENSAIQEQNINQIKAGIEEISRSVEDNSASAEETSATSDELATQAATLSALVQHFDLS